MNFLSPGFVWALILIAPLVAAYLLKVRPTRHPVTAMFLWSQIYSEKKATALLHKLRDLLSLLLLAAALIGLVVALTQPRFGESVDTDVVIIIDTSAAMNAKVDGATRIDLARDEAKRLIRQLHGSQRAAVVSASSELKFHAQLTDDVRQLLESVDEVDAESSPLNWHAISELVAQPGWLDHTKVVLLTDRDQTKQPGGDLLEVFAVGEPAQNVGIVACDMRRTAGENSELALFYRTASSFDKPVEIDMLLEQDGQLRRVVPVTIQPGENTAEHLLVQGGAGRWTAKLSIDDALSLDNTAYLYVPPPSPIAVAVRATEPYFLQHTVFAFQQGGEVLTLATEADARVVVTQGSWPTGAKRAIVFQPMGDSPAWSEVGDELAAALPRVMVKDHPALRFLDIESMQFAGARKVKATDDALVLVEDASGAPLLWEYVDRGTRGIVVNADATQSSLVFSATFPILIHGLASHLAGDAAELRASYAAGEIVDLSIAADTDVNVTSPAGEQLAAASSSMLTAEQPGFYTVGSGDTQKTVAVSLHSLDATLGGEAGETTVNAGVAAGYPPEYLLILLGAVLLVAESILYHRRKVG